MGVSSMKEGEETHVAQTGVLMERSCPRYSVRKKNLTCIAIHHSCTRPSSRLDAMTGLGPRRFRLRTAPALAKVYSWPTAARAKQTGEKRVVRGISRHGTRAGRIVTDSAHCEWRVACAHGINLDNMSLWKAHARRNSIVVANHYLNYTRK